MPVDPTDAVDVPAEDGALCTFHWSDDGRLVVRGDIDLAVLEEVLPVFCADETPLRLDLGGVRFIDSSGITLLLLLKQRRPLELVACSPAVERVLRTTGLADEFGLSDDDVPQ